MSREPDRPVLETEDPEFVGERTTHPRFPPDGPEASVREILVFAAVASLIFGAAVAFVVESWIFLGELPGAIWRVVFYGIGLGFVPATIFASRRQHRVLRSYLRLSSLFLGFLNYAFFVTLAVWLICLGGGVFGVPLDGRHLVFGAFLVAAAVTAAGFVNAAKIRVRRVTIRLEHLPSAWGGRSAVFLSDIHLGNVRGLRFLRRVVDRVRLQNPLTVLIGGDLFDGAKVDFVACAAVLASLQTPEGTFCVTGNHDEFHHRRRLLEALHEAGVRVLCNAKVEVEGMQILGVLDEDSADPERLASVLDDLEIDPTRPAILISHQPRNLATVARAGVRLQLSGHTHGGQFWPWTQVARRVHGVFNYGLNRFDERLQVLTSSGIGTWGPPMRVGTTPEIIVLEFAPA